jgi:hypothetical protein
MGSLECYDQFGPVSASLGQYGPILANIGNIASDPKTPQGSNLAEAIYQCDQGSLVF